MKTNRVHFRGSSFARRGMAPLELVMSLPFLLAISAIIFSIGVASLGKSTAAIDARHYVWKRRSNPPQNLPQLKNPTYNKTYALSVLSEFQHLPGEVYGEYENKMKVAPWLAPVARAVSGASVLASSWDHEEVKFSKYPDAPVLAQMASLKEAELQAVDAMNKLLSFFKKLF